MEKLVVYTNGGTFVFDGVDADNVYKSVNEAGVRGASWTVPTKLADGTEVFFVLDNISYVEVI